MSRSKCYGSTKLSSRSDPLINHSPLTINHYFKVKTMSEKISAVRGMNDILPTQTPAWQYLERTLKEIVESYGYQEIRFPLVENTNLFKRSVGEVTDIVEKEMYTFTDRSGDSLSLRPEGTACCVRAGIEHGLFYHQIQKWWYQGAFFRHERPQKGRYRQFHQFGVEAFGFPNYDIDAEMIIMTARFWQALGLTKDHVSLQINSLGTSACRALYRTKLIHYFTTHETQLDDDSRRRLLHNPLRILDSKNPDLKELIANAPRLLDNLDDESRRYFDQLKMLLDAAGVEYHINPCLVRGLDYYSHTVFEWVSSALGAQNTVCGGGRFDGLVEQLGGHATPAIGFAIGLERLLDILTTLKLLPTLEVTPDFYLLFDESNYPASLQLAEQLRDAMPHKQIILHCGGGSLKNQFKKADKSGAKIAIILDDVNPVGNRHAGSEACLSADKQVKIKYLREDRSQESMAIGELISYLKKL